MLLFVLYVKRYCINYGYLNICKGTFWHKEISFYNNDRNCRCNIVYLSYEYSE